MCLESHILSRTPKLDPHLSICICYSKMEKPVKARKTERIEGGGWLVLSREAVPESGQGPFDSIPQLIPHRLNTAGTRSARLPPVRCCFFCSHLPPGLKVLSPGDGFQSCGFHRGRFDLVF